MAEQTQTPLRAPPTAMAPRDDPLEIFGAAPAPAGQGGIPADYDPFADMFAPETRKAPHAGAAPPAELRLGTGDTSGQSLDQLFGLGGGAAPELFPNGNPLSDPGQRPDARDERDPLVALGGAPQPRYPDTARDDTPQIRAAFIPPTATFGAREQARPDAAAAPSCGATPAPSISKAAEQEMVFSWDRRDGAAADGPIRAVVVPAQRGGDADVALPPPEAPAAIAPLPPKLPAAPDRAPGADSELLRAFLQGAGVPDLAMPAELTPEMMNQFGQLLREAARGTLDLLLSRALVKQEVRADVTIIRPRENNPLKFSPSVEVALAHLLAPRGGGFMAPVPAMKDAFDDLRAHQFGFMAGMRAALEGVLERFDPAQLELRLTEKSVFDSLLPASRKAKLWDRFSELYTEIGKEAGDDFHALFGKAFLRAYEAQLAQLEQAGRADTR
ncbi:MAG: type secretion system-associated domain protein TagH, partial [Nevskia sp.]|nr:type secretion system-associated domain protein TagH [Nevskia sp.]